MGRWTVGRLRVLVVLACITALALTLYAGFVEPRWIEVTRHRLVANVRSPLRIAHLTDLHTHGLGAVEEETLRRLDAERPDVIAITGDTATRGVPLSAARPVLARLKAPLGVYAVNGNWEHWVPVEDAARVFADSGVVLLDNAYRRIREDVWIVGLDDSLAGAPDADSAFAAVPAGAFSIALFHSPELFDRIADRADLCLAGHTHGGQVKLPFLGAPWVPPGSGRYREGWYTRGAARLYVSRGIGMSIARVRFLCRPEIAILDVIP